MIQASAFLQKIYWGPHTLVIWIKLMFKIARDNQANDSRWILLYMNLYSISGKLQGGKTYRTSISLYSYCILSRSLKERLQNNGYSCRNLILDLQLWIEFRCLSMDNCDRYGEWLQSWESWLKVNHVEAFTRIHQLQRCFTVLCTLRIASIFKAASIAC